jgi:hypothetical protein
VRGKLCDCIVFWAASDLELVVPAELKGRQADARESVAQIQNGATLADELVASHTYELGFLPLLVHRGLGTIESKLLRRLRVTFRAKRYAVATARCGSRLTDVLRRFKVHGS